MRLRECAVISLSVVGLSFCKQRNYSDSQGASTPADQAAAAAAGLASENVFGDPKAFTEQNFGSVAGEVRACLDGNSTTGVRSYAPLAQAAAKLAASYASQQGLRIGFRPGSAPHTLFVPHPESGTRVGTFPNFGTVASDGFVQGNIELTLNLQGADGQTKAIALRVPVANLGATNEVEAHARIAGAVSSIVEELGRKLTQLEDAGEIGTKGFASPVLAVRVSAAANERSASLLAERATLATGQIPDRWMTSELGEPVRYEIGRTTALGIRIIELVEKARGNVRLQEGERWPSNAATQTERLRFLLEDAHAKVVNPVDKAAFARMIEILSRRR